MAPKRRSSSRLVVKTTKQVVKETVEVSVVQSKKRRKKVTDDEQQEPVESTIAFKTEEENKTEKVEVSVDKEPPKIIIPIESQHEVAEEDIELEETRTIPVEYAAMVTPERQEVTTPSVDKEPSTVGDDNEPLSKDVVVENQQEESETQNYEEARETISTDSQDESETQNFEETTPMTPEKREENQPSKGVEEKSEEVKPVREVEEKKDKKRKRRSAGKNREGSGGEEYKRYVYKVLKQVHPELGMSAKAMVVLNNYMKDMFERLADEAAKLTMYTARKTLSSREIQGAVKLVLPGELGKHAMAEGTKAVSNYLSKNAPKSRKS